MRALLLMYKLSGKKKITHSHHYETSNRITLENKSTVHAADWFCLVAIYIKNLSLQLLWRVF
jgi:hypothetical protein